MPVRSETYCGGRLVKVFDQIDVMSVQNMRHEYIDGRHTWQADGREIPEDAAKTMLAEAGETESPAPLTTAEW